VIWKRVAGRTITPELARQLLEDRKTKEVVSGFRSRAGKPFRARLVLNEEDKVEFEFPGPRRGAPSKEQEPEPEPAAAE
jgi:DNA topoisomerase-3